MLYIVLVVTSISITVILNSGNIFWLLNLSMIYAALKLHNLKYDNIMLKYAVVMGAYLSVSFQIFIHYLDSCPNRGISLDVQDFC